MNTILEDRRLSICYLPEFREYGIWTQSAVFQWFKKQKKGFIPEPSGGFQQMIFCPWCGLRLPDSLRDAWFDQLEKLWFDDPINQKIPKEFKSDLWWKNQNL